MKEEDYLNVNKESWNKRTEDHYQSDFYDLKGFIAGNSSLNPIELALLGDVSGSEILHLQCHFGQDTLSLARMGAKVTGVDFSDVAIQKAQQLAKEIQQDAQFVCTDVYDSVNHIHQTFDTVFVSYGTIGWLPDVNKWAQVISRFLKPGGKLIFVEFHPVVWMFDDDFTHIQYKYMKEKAIFESITGSYAATDSKQVHHSISWNHGLAEVTQSLINNGLQIVNFQEYDYSPYNCFAHGKKVAEKKYVISHLGNKIPMVYSLVAQKPR